MNKKVDTAITGNREIYFISKSANWQLYRRDILRKLGSEFGAHVQVLTTGQLKDYIIPDDQIEYKIHVNWFPQTWKISFFPGAILQIIKNRPAAVLCLNNTTQITEYVSLVICKLLRIRFVWWTHAYDHGFPHRNRILKSVKEIYTLIFLRMGDAVVAFSKRGYKYLLDKNLDKQKLFYAPNTLDTDTLTKQFESISSSRSKSEVLKELGFKSNDSILLYSGRLNRDKKVENLLEIFPKVLKSKSNTYLVIIGCGEEYEKLLRLTEHRKIKNILFTGDIFDSETLTKWFYASNLFVMPGFVGLAIVHAFCFGLPIITERAKNHGPEIQYLAHGSNGYFVDEDDSDDFADKIIRLLSNDSQRNDFSDNARKTVLNEANVNKLISSLAMALGLNSNT